MDAELKLLPCPFCGLPPQVHRPDPHARGGMWFVECAATNECGVTPQTFGATTYQQACSAWNRRKDA